MRTRVRTRIATIRRDDERGTSVVEFAMVSVPLLLLLFGIILFSVALSFKQSVTQAATEGARAAAPVSWAASNSNASTAAASGYTNALGPANKALGGWKDPATGSPAACAATNGGANGSVTCTGVVIACSSSTTSECFQFTVLWTGGPPNMPNVPLVPTPKSMKSVASVGLNP